MGAFVRNSIGFKQLAVIINPTDNTVSGSVIKSGRPAITRASMKNIFLTPFGVMPIDIYLANSLFRWRIKPKVLENTFAIPMTASSTHKAPIIILYPFTISSLSLLS